MRPWRDDASRRLRSRWHELRLGGSNGMKALTEFRRRKNRHRNLNFSLSLLDVSSGPLDLIASLRKSLGLIPNPRLLRFLPNRPFSPRLTTRLETFFNDSTESSNLLPQAFDLSTQSGQFSMDRHVVARSRWRPRMLCHPEFRDDCFVLLEFDSQAGEMRA